MPGGPDRVATDGKAIALNNVGELLVRSGETAQRCAQDLLGQSQIEIAYGTCDSRMPACFQITRMPRADHCQA